MESTSLFKHRISTVLSHCIPGERYACVKPVPVSSRAMKNSPQRPLQQKNSVLHIPMIIIVQDTIMEEKNVEYFQIFYCSYLADMFRPIMGHLHNWSLLVLESLVLFPIYHVSTVVEVHDFRNGGIAPIEIDRQLCQVYGPNVMSKQMCHRPPVVEGVSNGVFGSQLLIQRFSQVNIINVGKNNERDSKKNRKRLEEILEPQFHSNRQDLMQF
ncbi:hypothetical protein ANN_13846 [Periplaneta americana]|uniref:Uncharacterized protein n=1 Tax=Periplaneta americana TaxID=6978 RepID=A0ABQ8SUS1_PERAM|nr:hypothetical protein ANN_13846 [Periplaneta americana]